MTHWTYDDYKAYIKRTGALPLVQAKMQSDEIANSTAPVMNTWEQRYYDEYILLHPKEKIYFNCIKFRLAKKTYYTPDFVNFTTKTVVEIKGFRRSTGMTKFKIAREMYPDFIWLMIEIDKDNGNWKPIKI